MRAEIPVWLATLLGFTLLAGCAGLVPGQSSALPAQARSDESDEKAVTRTKGEASGGTRGQRAVGCRSGRTVRSAYYWQGRRTASGERFNPDGLTAAHRTLPFGTRLTVTNPRTGKSVDVVINDRGPFTRGLHLDLSRGAARAIGLTGTGTVCISS
ncbi:MAG: septal ring lytic transglycosylase RlpA family protein [Xanthobacteraceae bacterium]